MIDGSPYVVVEKIHAWNLTHVSGDRGQYYYFLSSYYCALSNYYSVFVWLYRSILCGHIGHPVTYHSPRNILYVSHSSKSDLEWPHTFGAEHFRTWTVFPSFSPPSPGFLTYSLSVNVVIFCFINYAGLDKFLEHFLYFFSSSSTNSTALSTLAWKILEKFYAISTLPWEYKKRSKVRSPFERCTLGST